MVNLENKSLKDEISDLKKVNEKWTYSKVTLDQLLSEQVPEKIVKALGGKGAEPVGTSNSLISLADLTLNMDELTLNTLVPKMTKLTYDKVLPLHTIKKNTKTKSPAFVPQLKKKVDLSAEQLLLTLMDEVKSLKEQIKVPSDNTPSISQTGSLESSKGKQTTWVGPCKHCGFKNDLDKDCYLKPKCSTYGSTDHLTKEHLEQFAINKTLIKLKAQSSMNPSAKKAPMIPKPFKECKYCGLNDHHFDNYEYYLGCEVCGSVAPEPLS
ncbi:hypothetical protein Tco_0729749 [Tanacetum coccineum]|uniref:Uncharacterized protein n=1 Tax=Tanacetum coccineum TaxID=301880 RepID=A0ABQ4YTD1_9ASTR